MRLIDADLLKSKMNKAALGGHLYYYVCGVIDDAPTIEAEPVKHGQWISCNDRMPETLTETLDGRYSNCCLVFAEETGWMGMAYYRTNNNISWWAFADAQNKPKIDWAEITHWMPLPNYPNWDAKDGGKINESCE